MEFLNRELQQYVESHTSPEPAILKKLNRQTNAEVLMPRMLSGHFQGRVLSMLSHMIRPRRILEIGTYTGYSALSLAEGLEEDGLLITIDINEELEGMVRNYFQESGFAEKINYIIGDARNVIPALNDLFDLVFIDADKINYLQYLEMVIEKVRKGGIIIADNVLWSGKILSNSDKKMDKDTAALMEFNSFVQNDPRVENVLLPIRDGLMIIRKL